VDSSKKKEMNRKRLHDLMELHMSLLMKEQRAKELQKDIEADKEKIKLYDKQSHC